MFDYREPAGGNPGLIIAIDKKTEEKIYKLETDLAKPPKNFFN